MEYEITIPPPLAEPLLTEAARREISAEKIVTRAMKEYLKRGESFAG